MRTLTNDKLIYVTIYVTITIYVTMYVTVYVTIYVTITIYVRIYVTVYVYKGDWVEFSHDPCVPVWHLSDLHLLKMRFWRYHNRDEYSAAFNIVNWSDSHDTTTGYSSHNTTVIWNNKMTRLTK